MHGHFSLRPSGATSCFAAVVRAATEIRLTAGHWPDRRCPASSARLPPTPGTPGKKRHVPVDLGDRRKKASSQGRSLRRRPQVLRVCDAHTCIPATSQSPISYSWFSLLAPGYGSGRGPHESSPPPSSAWLVASHEAGGSELELKEEEKKKT